LEGVRVVTENDMTNVSRSQPNKNNYSLLALGGIVLALAGFVFGRAYPAHSYQQIGTSSYLFDTHTGKLCAPFRASEEAAHAANFPPGNVWTEALAKAEKENPKDKASADMIPACGSE
jgi:hypothetical protein